MRALQQLLLALAAVPLCHAAAQASQAPTPDKAQACGGGQGQSCDAGQCCGPDNKCGTSDQFCRKGCQPSFGICDNTAPMTDGKPSSMHFTVFDSKNCSETVLQDIVVANGQDSVCINFPSTKVSLNGRGRGTCEDNALIATYYTKQGCSGEKVVYGEFHKEQCRDMSVGTHDSQYQSVDLRCQSHQQENCVLPDGTLGTGGQCDKDNAKPKMTDDDGYKGVYKASESSGSTNSPSSRPSSTNMQSSAKPTGSSKPDKESSSSVNCVHNVFVISFSILYTLMI